MRTRAQIESPEGERERERIRNRRRRSIGEELENLLEGAFTPAISPLINCGEDAPNCRAFTVTKKSPRDLAVLRMRLKVDVICDFIGFA